MRRTIRGLLREGIFEAPPATLSKVVEWATKVYAGHVLALVNQYIEREQSRVGQADLSKYDKLLADHEKMIANVDRYIDKVRRGRDVVLKLFDSRSWVHGNVMGLKLMHYDAWHVERVKGFMNRGGRRLIYRSGDSIILEIDPEEGKAGHRLRDDTPARQYIIEDIEAAITMIKAAKEKEKAYAARAQADPRKTSDNKLDELLALKAEVEKYNNKPKAYKGRTSTTIPIDLSGWKYVPDEQSVIDAWNRGTQRLRDKKIKQMHKHIDRAIKNFRWAQENLAGKSKEEVEDIRPPPEARGYWTGQTYYHAIDWRGEPREFEPMILQHATYRKDGRMSSWSKIPISRIQKELEALKSAEDHEEGEGPFREQTFKLVLDFKGHQRRSGQWSIWDKQMELDVWWRTPSDLKGWERSLSRLRSISRHETQHLGQDMLKMVARLDQDAGLPSRHIMDPRYTVGGEKKSTQARDRREHALRDVEFYTRLADDIDRFMRDLEDMPPEHRTPIGHKNLFMEYLRGGSRSGFFAQLRKAWHEHREIADKRKTKKAKAKAEALAKRYHRRYKKAASEFLKGIRDRGFDPLESA